MPRLGCDWAEPGWASRCLTFGLKWLIVYFVRGIVNVTVLTGRCAIVVVVVVALLSSCLFCSTSLSLLQFGSCCCDWQHAPLDCYDCQCCCWRCCCCCLCCCCVVVVVVYVFYNSNCCHCWHLAHAILILLHPDYVPLICRFLYCCLRHCLLLGRFSCATRQWNWWIFMKRWGFVHFLLLHI